MPPGGRVAAAASLFLNASISNIDPEIFRIDRLRQMVGLMYQLGFPRGCCKVSIKSSKKKPDLPAIFSKASIPILCWAVIGARRERRFYKPVYYFASARNLRYPGREGVVSRRAHRRCHAGVIYAQGRHRQTARRRHGNVTADRAGLGR